MKRLKNLHRHDRAAIVLGGPSLFEQAFDFQKLRDKQFVIFLEAQALTRWFLASGVEPDYYLMQFPDKCQGNSLHTFIFRAFLAGIESRWFLKRAHLPILRDMKANFARYFEPGQPHRGPHKRYRWKPGVFLKDSPYDLTRRLGAEVKIIANKELLDERFPGGLGRNGLHLFAQSHEQEEFDLERYYNPDDSRDLLTLRNVPFFNSVAIGLYPLLHYMGFKEVFFFGMDMSMLGSFEYAAPYSFKTMWHFRRYFSKTNRVFNANYVRNRPYYLRPPYEFENIKRLPNYPGLRFTRVHDPFKWAAPAMDGLRTISFREFLNQ
ncbi:MAG: hypothetical protein VX471_07095 [Acidobacteriota bacterium]|nr:hypothetical protein [Acidobacteriota bacterium]